MLLTRSHGTLHTSPESAKGSDHNGSPALLLFTSICLPQQFFFSCNNPGLYHISYSATISCNLESALNLGLGPCPCGAPSRRPPSALCSVLSALLHPHSSVTLPSCPTPPDQPRSQTKEGRTKKQGSMSNTRPAIVGPDSGPEPPFPLQMEGTVIKGFGRGSKEVSWSFLIFISVRTIISPLSPGSYPSLLRVRPPSP